MRYACLVYVDEAKLDELADPERIRLWRETADRDEELRRSGHLVAAEYFQSVRASTTMRVRGGSPVMVDGPATEAAEQLSGVLVVEARDLNEAMRLAARIPSGRLGSIEIRPIRPGRRDVEANAGHVRQTS